MKTFSKTILCALFISILNFAVGQTDEKKVLIHYMGWFEEGESTFQWHCGHTNTPVIGCYNSLSWAAQVYHILLSWSCGIDGLVINVKSDYDAECMKSLVQTLKRLNAMTYDDFIYDFSISYDDQGLSDVNEAETKLIYLRDYILTEPISFLRYNTTPAIFAFNYPGEYLTAEDFDTALDEVFPTNRPVLVWNQIETDALGYANSFFPWVQPGNNTWNGTNWGEVYLNWFYPELDYYTSQLDFATGGVWAGFDDRENDCWEGSRWIDRQNGWVYNKTWEYVNNYSGDVPLIWTVIETWNDWNEGTEIEPSLEDGYKYLKLTIDNINTFKGTNISNDTVKFEIAKQIFFLADSIERGLLDSTSSYPALEDAINSFIHDYPVAIASNVRSAHTMELDISPNPAASWIQFNISSDESTKVSLSVLDMNGQLIKTVYSGYLQEGEKTIQWNSSTVKRGMYICLVKSDQYQIVKRMVLL